MVRVCRAGKFKKIELPSPQLGAARVPDADDEHGAQEFTVRPSVRERQKPLRVEFCWMPAFELPCQARK